MGNTDFKSCQCIRTNGELPRLESSEESPAPAAAQGWICEAGRQVWVTRVRREGAGQFGSASPEPCLVSNSGGGRVQRR